MSSSRHWHSLILGLLLLSPFGLQAEPSSTASGIGIPSSATEIPTQPRGYALVCSVLAMAVAVQQACFKKKPRAYQPLPEEKE